MKKTSKKPWSFLKPIENPRENKQIKIILKIHFK